MHRVVRVRGAGGAVDSLDLGAITQAWRRVGGHS